MSPLSRLLTQCLTTLDDEIKIKSEALDQPVPLGSNPSFAFLICVTGELLPLSVLQKLHMQIGSSNDTSLIGLLSGLS